VTTTLDTIFAQALRRELVTLPAQTSRAWGRKPIVFGSAALLALLSVGTVTAVANLRPPGEVAAAPLAAPVLVNGVGPATVALPAAPADARYVRIELICFDGTLCASPGGSIKGSSTPKIERASLPVNQAFDPDNVQILEPIDPSVGVPVIVNPGTHWRLYALYVTGLNPEIAKLEDSTTLGIPGNDVIPDLVPVQADNGDLAWVRYDELTNAALVELTPAGVRQAPLRAYGKDGVTIVGQADVSKLWR
jgi:hypothetical protein